MRPYKSFLFFTHRWSALKLRMLSPVVKWMMSEITEQRVCSILWKENKTFQQKPYSLENEQSIAWEVSKSGKKSTEIEGHPARFSDKGIYIYDLSEYLLGMNWQTSRNQNDSLRRTESIRLQFPLVEISFHYWANVLQIVTRNRFRLRLEMTSCHFDTQLFSVTGRCHSDILGKMPGFQLGFRYTENWLNAGLVEWKEPIVTKRWIDTLAELVNVFPKIRHPDSLFVSFI